MMADLMEAVSALGVGQQAALRRCAGRCLRDADAGALQALYSVMPVGLSETQQEQYFAVVSMMCLWKPEQRRLPKPFAECLKVLNNSENTVKRRLMSLLDTAWNYDEGFLISKMTRLARYIHSTTDVYPDFEQLLKDLRGWNSPERYVQRRWMSQFMSVSEDAENENTNIE